MCGLLCEENLFFLIFVPFYWFDQKRLLQIQIFLRIYLFKCVKINKLSEYFSAPFWESHFFDKKEKFTLNISQNASKQKTSIGCLYVAHLDEKNNFFLIYSHFTSLKGGTTPFSPEIFIFFFVAVITFFPLSSVQIIFIPACCLLCVL